MEIIERTIERSNGEDLVIAPLGDIQYTGRPEHIAGRRLDAHIKRCMDLGAWFVGTGDYIDFVSPSNRRKIRNSDLYDNATTVIQDSTRRLVDELYAKHLAVTKGRWLGLVEGHHYGYVSEAYTSDEYLAWYRLDCERAKACMLVCITIEGPKDRKGTVMLWVHHGESSGDPIPKLQKIAGSFYADYYIMGHTTHRAVKPCAYVYPHVERYRYLSLRDRVYWLVSAGGWLRAYAEGNADYAERAMYTPAALGSPILTIKCQWTKNRVWTPEFRAEG